MSCRSLRFNLFLILVIACNRLIAQNLIQNPGFEFGMTNWGSYGFTVVTNSPAAHSGTNSAQINGIVNPIFSGVTQDLAEIPQPRQTYRFSVWMKSASGATTGVRMDFNYMDAAGFHRINVFTAATTPSWSEFSTSFSFTNSGTVTDAWIDIGNNSPGGAAIYLLDDISLVAWPILDIRRVNNFVLLEWPTNASGYVLQTTTNLSSAIWNLVPDPPQTSGTNKRVILSMTNQHRSFRLQKP